MNLLKFLKRWKLKVRKSDPVVESWASSRSDNYTPNTEMNIYYLEYDYERSWVRLGLQATEF